MGAWGHKPEESDDYLDLLARVLKPCKAKLDSHYAPTDDIVNEAALYLKLMTAHDGDFYYHGEEKFCAKVEHKLRQLYDTPKAFEAWRNPEERRNIVADLITEYHQLSKHGSRGTTLFAKIKAHTGSDPVLGVIDEDENGVC